MYPGPRNLTRETTETYFALQRAAANARELSRRTRTPFYVVKNGRIIDLNAGGRFLRIFRRG